MKKKWIVSQACGLLTSFPTENSGLKKKCFVVLAACAIALAGCKIVSEPEPIAVQSVTLNTTTLTLTIEDDWTRTLVATVYPYNADNRTVTWYSSNPEVADVDSWGGVVTAHSEGTTTISAYAGNCMASCEVTVKHKAVAVQSITLDESSITLEQGARRILVATVYPEDADDKTVIWLSSNTEVARVYSDGMVVAMSSGSAIITAQALGNGDTAQCLVTVSETFVEQPDTPAAVEVENVTLNAETLILEPNTTSELIATVTPPDADYTSVIWRTSNWEVAQVDDYGNVTTYSKGTAIITAQVGDKTATCEVTVRHIANPVTGVTIDKETLSIIRGEERTLKATVMPSNADYTNVTWSTTDWDIVEFDVDSWNNGTCTIKADKMGTATITVTTEEGGFTAKCEVTVLSKPIESITFASSTLFLECNETGYMDYSLMPIYSYPCLDDRTLTWSSSDETIATVDEYGDVTGHKVGKAIITATARAGGKTATYVVSVHKHSYSEGKCIVCGANPKMKNGTIDKDGVLTKYDGSDSTVEIPEGVTKIGDQAFYNNNSNKYLTSVKIPDSVKSIGRGAFSSCKELKSVTMGNGVTSIGDGAFGGCTGLTSVTIPNSVTSIGSGAFRECTGLTSVTIPDGVKSIEDRVFNGCTSLENVTIGNGVKSIGDKTFNGCKNLKSVTIGNSVTSIGINAFYECTNLESVTIPSSITNIGNSAFHNCRNLTTVTYGGTLADWCSITWNDDVEPFNYSANPLSNENAVLYIDNKAVKDAVIPNNVTEIKYHAFYRCTSLESVTIPGSVKTIGKQAFYECAGLKKVTINNGVTSIEMKAFYECTSLTDVTIPGSVKTIGMEAFHRCSNLTTVPYDDTNNEWKDIEIGNSAFPYNCVITGTKGDSWAWNFNGWL